MMPVGYWCHCNNHIVLSKRSCLNKCSLGSFWQPTPNFWWIGPPKQVQIGEKSAKWLRNVCVVFLGSLILPGCLSLHRECLFDTIRNYLAGRMRNTHLAEAPGRSYLVCTNPDSTTMLGQHHITIGITKSAQCPFRPPLWCHTEISISTTTSSDVVVWPPTLANIGWCYCALWDFSQIPPVKNHSD